MLALCEAGLGVGFLAGRARRLLSFLSSVRGRGVEGAISPEIEVLEGNGIASVRVAVARILTSSTETQRQKYFQMPRLGDQPQRIS